MTHQLMSKVSMIAMPAMIAGCLLMSGALAQAQRENSPLFSQSSEQGCSNRTLSGDYGFTIEGTILDANLPIRGLALQHYDGRGHITQVDHVVFGGYPPSQDWTPGTGTYTVNPDCTGSGVINSPSNPTPVAIHFVIVDHGRQIKQVVDANAVVANGVKVD
jgi:hypothetical protein